MNLGDGLLFELENGKPRLILLSHGLEKNPVKQLSLRSRGANILSTRQPSCVEEAHGGERPARQLGGRHREARGKAGGATASSVTSTADGRSTTLSNHHKGGSVKMVAKLKSDRHKHGTAVGPPRANGKTGASQNTVSRSGGVKDALTNEDAGQKESSVVCLTNQQLQHILNTVQGPAENHSAQGDPKSIPSVNDGGEMKEDSGVKERGGSDTNRSSQEKDSRSFGCLLSWLEERQSLSRAAVEARKAQWKRDLDEQVALKQQQQQRSAPGRLQAEQDAESVLSVQSSVSHREQPAAIRSSLRLGEVSPMEEVLGLERREEQRRRWLEELDRQREETSERRRREKLLQNQTEDHQLWATHFDSLQRRPPVQAPSAPPPAQFSERGDWEPTSSLSLWEATSSCGAESVGGVSVDTSGGYPARTSHLRTMTSLLDPAQIEERERRRLKQLEQQRVIQAQVEEQRRKRQQEEAKRRQEEEEEERRVQLEREMLQRQYQLDTLRERQKEESPQEDSRLQDAPEHTDTSQSEALEDAPTSYKDTAVQTDAAPSVPLGADRGQSLDVSTEYQPPPPPNSRSRAPRAEKENVCVQAGGDPYEPFARTDRSWRDKRRPEWNTQRPSRRFVPASERYPVALQKNRQESRLKRQAELLALQERTRLSRAEPPAQHQELRIFPTKTRTSPTGKVESGLRRHSDAERGSSPPVPAVRHRAQNQPASTPPPVLEFIPYVRTDEVFNLDPLEPADTPPLQHTHTGAPPPPPAPSHLDPLLHPELLRDAHTNRQQEILRGLAQLRQGLLQKQRELETDLNPHLKRHDNEHQPHVT